jgi:hypothetical protein
MRVNINSLIKTCGTRTVPAAETKSIGLRRTDVVFASPLRQFYHDGTTSYPLPGFSNLPTLSERENSRPSTGTLQKRCTPDTDGNLKNRLAVSKH